MASRVRAWIGEHRHRSLELAVAVATLAALVVVANASGLLRSDGAGASRAERIAQEEIARLQALGWDTLLMTRAPAPSADPGNPFSGLSGDGERMYAPPRAPAEPLAVAEEPYRDPDYVTPQPGEWSEGEQWGKVFRFVTWTHDRSAKRVTVAVTIDGPERTSAVHRTIVVEDPTLPARDAQPVVPDPELAEDDPRVTLYAYDTPARFKQRQDPARDHAVHATEGYPDLMGAEQPPNPFTAPKAPPERNYSDDLGTVAAGRLVERARSGCDGEGSEQVQLWTSAPYEAPVTLTGGVSASLWSYMAGAAPGPAKVCIGIYDVKLAASGAVAGEPELLGSVWHQVESWPTEPKMVPIDFRFLDDVAHTIESGHSIGLKLTVDESSAADLAVLYDHPNYATTFQFETSGG